MAIRQVIFQPFLTSPTALRLPVEEICCRARQQGILTVIDAAHSPGQIPLDLQALGADVVFGNAHKWMLAPKGAAFLYVRRPIQPMIEPLVVSWGYGNPPEAGTGSRFIDFLQWSGTRDPAAFLSIPDAIRFMEQHHWKEVRRSCHTLLRSALEQIGRLTGLPPAYPLDSGFYSQMAVAPLPQETDLAQLKTRLYAEYKVEAPLTQWRENKFIRISVQGYNTPADIDALVAALTQLLPRP